ncbi:MAG TPA: alpha/beta hydrolase [Croceibacterium sp.]|nr:alpha/beta hydrolase [Croceibacterium sp.]
MANHSTYSRRRFLGAAAAGIVTANIITAESIMADTVRMDTRHAARSRHGGPALGFAPIKQIRAGVLDVGYFEMGPGDGPAVLLLHGFPYSIDSFVDVAPLLAARGCRVIVPYLRGHGTTRFLDGATPRSGQQGAIGDDLVAFLDALQLRRAVLAGYDWGGRAACVAAALWPERCTGLVSVNSYLIQDIARAGAPLPPSVESGLWYQFYFLTERGRAGLTAKRREIARTIWTRNSPTWRYDEATLGRHASAFENPDYVDVVIHSYRHRLGTAEGAPAYEDIERQLAALPPISVPTITLDGASDGVVPATDGKSTAAKFTGDRQHRVIPDVGHNLPEEAPREFAGAVWELASRGR